MNAMVDPPGPDAQTPAACPYCSTSISVQIDTPSLHAPFLCLTAGMTPLLSSTVFQEALIESLDHFTLDAPLLDSSVNPLRLFFFALFCSPDDWLVEICCFWCLWLVDYGFLFNSCFKN